MAGLTNAFSDIAHIYQLFNDNQIYQEWLAFTLRQCDKFPEKVLDIACGNGILTNMIGQFSHQFIGIDYDLKMIEQAKHNYPQGHWLVKNMLDLSSLDQDFDLVTCYLDSLCFLESQEALQLAINQAYHRLIPGGIFLCDVWTQERLLQFNGYEYVDFYEDTSLIWMSEAGFVDDIATVDHHLIGFERLKSSDYFRRITVDLTERTYHLNTYIDTFIQAGFKLDQIEVFPDASQEAAKNLEKLANDHTIERWFFKARKV